MATHEVDPISRIEGHLGIEVDVTAGFVTAARAHGNLWRGFENFLLNRDVNDAITFTQRICGVCPVPHGLTATYAADTALGYSAGHITFVQGVGGYTDGVPAKAVLIRNLVLGAETLMSSITHFYHLAAPSYVQGPAIPPWTPYFNAGYYNDLLENPTGTAAVPQLSGGFSANLWSTVIRSYVVALKIRRLTFEAGALFAGRMPMTSCFVAGGVTFNGQEDLTDRCNAFKSIIADVGKFVVKEYVPIALALGVLYQDWDNTANGGQGYGQGLGRFLSWGNFPNLDNSLTIKGGLYDSATPANNFTVSNRAEVHSKFLAGGTHAVPDNLTEDIAHSRYGIATQDTAVYTGTAAYPGDVSRTKPVRSNGYSYMKAPRWNGLACEVGPLARLVVSGMYPVDGTLLALTVPGYTTYARAFNAGVGAGITGVLEYPAGTYLGVDPRMIEADIAVALVREGLATVHLPDGTAVTDEATIVANYSSAIITGAICGWVLHLNGGLSTMDRLRARALESLVLVQTMIGAYDKVAGTFSGTSWISQLAAEADGAGTTWRDRPLLAPTGAQGWGAVEAPRGALMHQVTINGAGKITKYQCIVPTTWNGSPRDAGSNPGAIEKACEGVPFQALNCPTGLAGTTPSVGGVEILRVAQSFDPCIACAVH